MELQCLEKDWVKLIWISMPDFSISLMKYWPSKTVHAGTRTHNWYEVKQAMRLDRNLSKTESHEKSDKQFENGLEVWIMR